ncbi:ribonuclease HI family protein [Candidatus Roizmanbacteria bacterium]|nr:ribonuclease HI family protein [Candidatus Roizmanbacteria bacterium]
MKLIIHTDGGSRGNPGAGAVGVVIAQLADGKEQTVIEFGKKIGIVTNNEAEYRAVIEALKEVVPMKNRISSILFVMDSKLVCEQLRGNWKIKQDHLKELFEQAKSLEINVGVPIAYSHVLRDKNKRADELLNKALDTA